MLSPMSGGSWMDEVGRNAFNKPFFTPSTPPLNNTWHNSRPNAGTQSRSQSFSGSGAGDLRSAATRAAFLSIPEENAVDDRESSPPTAAIPLRRRSTATRPFERSFVSGLDGARAAAHTPITPLDSAKPNPLSDNMGLNAGATTFRPQNAALLTPPASCSELRRDSRRYSDVSSYTQMPYFQDQGHWPPYEEQRRNRANLPPRNTQPFRHIPQSMPTFNPNPDYPLSHPDSKIAVILFKMQRADLFLLPRSKSSSDWASLLGRMVIVEADRGVDLGKIVWICDSLDEAMQWKLACMKEHYDLLLNLCQSPRPPDWDEELAFCQFFEFNPSHSPLTRGSRESNLRCVKREASEQEVESYARKLSYEEKAKKLCCQLIRKHGLNVEIVEAEFQLDMHKLTFYFWSPHYLHFSALVTDLFKIFKNRIWLTALNPASCIPAAAAAAASASGSSSGQSHYSTGQPGYSTGQSGYNNNRGGPSAGAGSVPNWYMMRTPRVSERDRWEDDLASLPSVISEFSL